MFVCLWRDIAKRYLNSTKRAQNFGTCSMSEEGNRANRTEKNRNHVSESDWHLYSDNISTWKNANIVRMNDYKSVVSFIMFTEQYFTIRILWYVQESKDYIAAISTNSWKIFIGFQFLQLSSFIEKLSYIQKKNLSFF